eukprot:scaffold256999_cov17-Tisochrysis_lutea.AAC.3
MSKMGLQWPGERWKVGINVIDFLTHGKRDTRMWEESCQVGGVMRYHGVLWNCNKTDMCMWEEV